jgi:tRNA threonylcarbamoyladenosine biosynthesis protein TsaB
MFLIIDTATNRGLIALGAEYGVVSCKELVLGLANSRLLEPSLQKLLQEAGITPKDLEYVAVGQGPGSYTGLRVGAACAKAISIGCGIPLVGISSLRGFSPPSDFLGSYLAVIDAKIGGVYVLEALQTKDGITFLSEDRLVPFDQFVQELKRVPYIVTPAWEPLAKRLQGILAPTVFETGPSAKRLLVESNEKFVKKDCTEDGTLPLLYLRLTQAEMEKLPNKGQLQ